MVRGVARVKGLAMRDRYVAAPHAPKAIKRRVDWINENSITGWPGRLYLIPFLALVITLDIQFEVDSFWLGLLMGAIGAVIIRLIRWPIYRWVIRRTRSQMDAACRVPSQTPHSELYVIFVPKAIYDQFRELITNNGGKPGYYLAVAWLETHGFARLAGLAELYKNTETDPSSKETFGIWLRAAYEDCLYNTRVLGLSAHN